MNKHLKISASIVGGVMMTMAAGSAMAQVVGSQHDLTATGTGQGGTTATDEVCVFCHTPHGSATGAPVPLWNKVLADPATYTTYATLATPTLDGTEAPVGSVSLACLSCHDGTQAMDVVLNAPGSGNYVATGASIGGSGAMVGEPVPMLGQDLTNDHPIGIQYCGGGRQALDADGEIAAGTTATGACDDADFNEPSKATINGNPIWWVNTSATAGTNREKTDMILYTRNEALDSAGNPFPTGQTGQQPFVECGTCHDPHNSSTFAAGQSVAFLRITNTASRICTACHTK